MEILAFSVWMLLVRKCRQKSVKPVTSDFLLYVNYILIIKNGQTPLLTISKKEKPSDGKRKLMSINWELNDFLVASTAFPNLWGRLSTCSGLRNLWTCPVWPFYSLVGTNELTYDPEPGPLPDISRKFLR